MTSDEQEFLAILLETFKIEAEEHLTILGNGLLELERDPQSAKNPELIEQLFREAHSLKGAARAVELTDIESVCQAVESVLSTWKAGAEATTHQFDVLNEAVDFVRESGTTPSAERDAAVIDMVAKVEALLTGDAGARPAAKPAARKPVASAETPPAGKPRPAGKAAPAEQPAEQPAPLPAQPAPGPVAPASAAAPPAAPPAPGAAPGPAAAADTIRVSLRRLTDLMLRMEELIGVKVSMRRQAAETNDLLDALAIWSKKGSALRAEMRRPEERAEYGLLGDYDAEDPQYRRHHTSDALFDYVKSSQEFLTDVDQRLRRLGRMLELDERAAAPLIDEILEDMKSVIMMPFSSLSQSLPKMVRDLARAEGRAVDLRVTGDDIEIDRHVLETIKDPILHILRNGVGHGIETPDVRSRRGKPVRGTITMAVDRGDGNEITITIADDGGGIDVERLREAAQKGGVRSAEELARMQPQQLIDLVFVSGITTNAIVTDVAGRGLGMSIVMEKVERLGGRVTVRSEPHHGTTFVLTVPATVASSRGLVVRVGARLYVVPTTHVDRVARVRLEDIGSIEGAEVMDLDGENVTFAFLHDSLGLARQVREDEAEYISVVVMMAGHERVAFAVDWILGEQEVLVKSLGPLLESVLLVTGATILDGDKIALILNPPLVMRTAALGGVPRRHSVADAVELAHKAPKSILIAEDSITSRTLLKNVLEAAGYVVHTTVDGAEAFAALREQPVDLVISDVEMPRMNGFDLCARIRAEADLADLPFMLVTSLDSAADRERGVDVGANAYITKGGFDQAVLLETARRLL